MRRCALILIVALALLATPKNEIAWLDAKVVSVGHVSARNGERVRSATVVLYDPGNSSPLARQQVWVVKMDSDARKTRVSLTVGTQFKAYRTGETRAGYGFLAIRYLDDKGREKSELHYIVRAFGTDDIG